MSIGIFKRYLKTFPLTTAD